MLMKKPHFLSVVKFVFNFIRKICGFMDKTFESIACGHLFVLVCCHSDKFSLRKHVCFECAVGKFEDVVGSNDMKPRLIFVHGV